MSIIKDRFSSATNGSAATGVLLQGGNTDEIFNRVLK
jgi:hypothetical protein